MKTPRSREEMTDLKWNKNINNRHIPLSEQNDKGNE